MATAVDLILEALDHAIEHLEGVRDRELERSRRMAARPTGSHTDEAIGAAASLSLEAAMDAETLVRHRAELLQGVMLEHDLETIVADELGQDKPIRTIGIVPAGEGPIVPASLRVDGPSATDLRKDDLGAYRDTREVKS